LALILIDTEVVTDVDITMNIKFQHQ